MAQQFAENMERSSVDSNDVPPYRRSQYEHLCCGVCSQDPRTQLVRFGGQFFKAVGSMLAKMLEHHDTKHNFIAMGAPT